MIKKCMEHEKGEEKESFMSPLDILNSLKIKIKIKIEQIFFATTIVENGNEM